MGGVDSKIHITLEFAAKNNVRHCL